MSDLFPSFDDIMRAIRRAAENALEGALGGIPDYLRGLIDRALDTVDSAVHNLTNAVENAITSASATANRAIDAAEASVNRAIDAGKAVADNAVNKAAAVADNAIKQAAGLVSGAIDRAADSVDKALDNATGVAVTAIDRAGDAVDNIVGAADRRIGQALDSADRQLTGIRADTVKVVTETVQTGRAIADHALAVADARMGQAIQAGKDSLTTLATNVRGGLVEAGQHIENAVNGALTFARDGVDKALGFARSSVGDAIGRASDFVQRSIDGARDWIHNATATVGQGIQNALGYLAEVSEQARVAFLALYNDALAYLDKTWAGLKDYFERNFGVAWQQVQDLWKDFTTGQFDKVNAAQDAVTAIAGKLFSCGYDNYGAVIADISAATGDSGLAKFLVLAVLSAGVVIAGAPTAAQPYLQCIANIGLDEVRPMSADLVTLATAAQRGLPGGDTFALSTARQGIPDAMAAAYLATARNAMPVGQIVEALLHGAIDSQTAAAQMVDAQYDPALLGQFVDNARPLLSAADAFVAARRGGMTEAQAEAEASRAGWTEERRLAIRRLTDQLLTADEYVTAWLREVIDEPTLDSLLNERGYAARERDLVKGLAFFVPPPSDLVRMSLKDVWNKEIVDTFGLNEDLPDEFIKYARQQGISAFWAQKYWNMAWDYPSNTAGFEMFQRGIIDDGELRLLLKTNDVPPFWRERLIKLNYNPLTRVDIRRMFQLGVIDESQVTRAYLDIGYSPEDAQRLTEFTKRYTEDQNKSTADELQSLSRTQIEQAYIRGIFTEAAALAALKELRYDERDARLILQLASAKTANDDAAKRYQALSERTVKLIQSAYADQKVPSQVARELLGELGLDSGEIGRELALLDTAREVDHTASMIERIGQMFIRHIIDNQTTIAWLALFGVSKSEADALILTWVGPIELRYDQATRADLRRWVRNGTITPEEYAEELRGLGYAEKYVVRYVNEDSI